MLGGVEVDEGLEFRFAVAVVFGVSAFAGGAEFGRICEDFVEQSRHGGGVIRLGDVAGDVVTNVLGHGAGAGDENRFAEIPGGGDEGGLGCVDVGGGQRGCNGGRGRWLRRLR